MSNEVDSWNKRLVQVEDHLTFVCGFTINFPSWLVLTGFFRWLFGYIFDNQQNISVLLRSEERRVGKECQP